MTPRHLFIAPASAPSLRWIEAFPGARVISAQDPVPLADGRHALVWLCTCNGDWRDVLMRLRRDRPDAHVVVMSMRPQQDEGLAALELGARGYCHALSAPALLREIGEVIARDGLWVGPELLQRLITLLQPHLPRRSTDEVLKALSERETAVARLVAAGHSNKEVAQRLDITERTVKAHLSSIFGKLGIRDRLQLALRLGRNDAEPTLH